MKNCLILAVALLVLLLVGCHASPDTAGEIIGLPTSASEDTSEPLVVVPEPTPDPTPEPMPEPMPELTPDPSPVDALDAASQNVISPSSEPESSQSNTQNRKKSLSGLLIGIDAGHQKKANSKLEPISPGSDKKKEKVLSGTQGRFSGVPEYKITLDVALLLESKLRELGADVLMVRSSNNVDISNASRATMMNDAGVDLCIRIHADGSESSATHGASMLVPSKDSSVASASRYAGQIILQSFVEATGAKDNGVVSRSDLTGFNWSEVPVCLIEMGFMSNEKEDWLLVSQEYQRKCAQGLAEGIVNWALN